MALLNTGSSRLNGNLCRPRRRRSRAERVIELGLVNTSSPLDGVPITDIYRYAKRRFGAHRAYALCSQVWSMRAQALKDGRLDLEAADNVDREWHNEL